MDEQSVQLGPTESQYRVIPEHMREGMRRYIEYGQAPGDFLSAILCNDFMSAAAKADYINQRALFDYCFFLYNYAPAGSHSSHSNFSFWCNNGGLRGLTGQGEAPAASVAADAAGLLENAEAAPDITAILGDALRPAEDADPFKGYPYG
jgi:hypothetical protein